MNFAHYLRSRLHRRLFLWFGATILITGLVVGVTMSLLSGVWGSQWNREVERIQTYVGGRFARVWNDPVQRDELAASTSKDLVIGVRVEDEAGGVASAYGDTC